MLVILNNSLDFRFLELATEVNHSKYMTRILDKFQKVCSTNPQMIYSKNFTGPNPPELRDFASVAYFRDKLYYLGGWFSNRTDVKRSNESP